MTITSRRRAILAGAAALASVPTFAASPTVDPIFAAIEAHVAARAVYWTDVPGETNEQSDERLDSTSGAAEEALVNVLSTQPTTAAGCVAALRHIHEHVTQYEEAEGQLLGNSCDATHEAAGRFLMLIANALADAAVRS